MLIRIELKGSEKNFNLTVYLMNYCRMDCLFQEVEPATIFIKQLLVQIIDHKMVVAILQILLGYHHSQLLLVYSMDKLCKTYLIFFPKNYHIPTFFLIIVMVVASPYQDIKEVHSILQLIPQMEAHHLLLKAAFCISSFNCLHNYHKLNLRHKCTRINSRFL